MEPNRRIRPLKPSTEQPGYEEPDEAVSGMEGLELVIVHPDAD